MHYGLLSGLCLLPSHLNSLSSHMSLNRFDDVPCRESLLKCPSHVQSEQLGLESSLFQLLSRLGYENRPSMIVVLSHLNTCKLSFGQ